jgi:hypothetical protein
VCATKSLQRESRTRFTFHEALEIHNEVLKHLRRKTSILSYPYKIEPHCDFVNEISQLKSEALTISPFGYFVTKSTLTSNLTKTKKWLVNKIFYITNKP